MERKPEAFEDDFLPVVPKMKILELNHSEEKDAANNANFPSGFNKVLIRGLLHSKKKPIR
jgi:hypothetical protein